MISTDIIRQKTVKKNKLIPALLLVIIVLSSIPSFAERNGVYVLCYHAFLERKDPYSFSNEQFRDQLVRLRNSGFKFVTFDDMINDRISGTKNILITIDDGNKSVYQAYYSIMKPMGIKPVLGIYPAIIGKVHYAMTWDEVKRLADDGCYIASHGYHHMYLSTKYYDKEPQSFKKEIYLSKKVLEEKLGRKIELMVYPFGVSSDIAIAELKNAGYKYGMSLIQKISDVPISENFMIPRYMLTKPNQKGLIAYFAQNAEKMSMAANQPELTTQVAAVDGGKKDYKVTIKNYPQQIHKMVMNDVIFMPDKKVAVNKPNGKKIKTKKQPKFKPFVHKNAVNDKVSKNPKKQGTLPSKKDDEREARKQSTLLKDIKEAFFAVQIRFTAIVYSIREITADKVAVIKMKAFDLFS